MVSFEQSRAHAQYATLTLDRAPLFLRFTQNAKGEWDALDQLDDVAEPGERIVVAQRHGEFGTIHVDRTVRGRRVGEWYRTADYRPVADPPSDAVARDNEQWKRWCLARVEPSGTTEGE